MCLLSSLQMCYIKLDSILVIVRKEFLKLTSLSTDYDHFQDAVVEH